MTGNGTNPSVGVRLAALLFLAVIAANAAGFPRIGAGSWWNWDSGAFGRAAILSIAGVGAWRLREYHYHRCEAAFECAIRERTVALDRERLRDGERNQILKMVTLNEPLGSVLDAVVRLIVSQCPYLLCAIVTKRGDGCQVAAASDLPREWLLVLRTPHSLPSGIWRAYSESHGPHQDLAWKPFAAMCGAGAAGAVRSWPIGNHDETPGALLLFYKEGSIPMESDTPVAELGTHLAHLALEHRRLQDELHFQSQHDNLTGLANRTLYEEHLDRSLREVDARGQKLAIIFVDLDQFKRINDGFTHKGGDLVLAEAANRMKNLLRPGDTLARVGGDEFTIVVDDVDGLTEGADIASRLLQSIREPILIEGQNIEATASAGIALFPEDGRTAEQLERAAEAAMRHAKDLGRDRFQAFATRNETLDRARMEEQVRLGLRNNWFVVHYQPKVRADRRVVGFEALVRMNHPKRGIIPPGDFISIAEANGLIVPLGFWVLEDVCRQVAEWERLGFGQVPVAVNVSPIQICRADFADAVAKCLARYGIQPASIELELTEGMLISAAGVAQEQLRALRELGVQLSIDDFGTGYASLSYLHRLQFDSIKLDRSFVQSIDTDDLARRLVQAMIGVAQGLGLDVVAEGVETESQRAALIGAGCPLMQGFLFARPRPAGEVEDLLRLSALVPESQAGSTGSGDRRAHSALRRVEAEPATELTLA